MAQSLQGAEFQPSIKVEQAAGFLRRLTHDVRNALNAIDLQLLLVEGDEESVQQQIAEARQTISSEARRLGDLSNQFYVSSPQWITYAADGIVEDLRPRFQRKFGASMGRLDWPASAPDSSLRIDFEMLATVLGELLSNALRFADDSGRVRFSVCQEPDAVTFAVTNPRKVVHGIPEDWGKTPFDPEPRAGYGLGLFSSRRMTDAMGMDLNFSHDPVNAVLTSRLRVPIVEA